MVFPYEPDSSEGKKVLKNTSQDDLRTNYCFELIGPRSGVDSKKKTSWFYWHVPEKKHDKSGDTRNTFKAIPKQFLAQFHKDLKKKYKDYLEDPYKIHLYEKTGHIIFDHRFLESKIPQSQKKKKSNTNENLQEQDTNDTVLTFEVDPKHIREIGKNMKNPQRNNSQWNNYENIANNFPLNSIGKILNLNALSSNKSFLGMWKKEFIIQDPQKQQINKKEKIVIDEENDDDDDDEDHLSSLIQENDFAYESCSICTSPIIDSPSPNICKMCVEQIDIENTKEMENEKENGINSTPSLQIEETVNQISEINEDKNKDLLVQLLSDIEIKVNICSLWTSLNNAIINLKNIKMMPNDSRFNSETDIGKCFSDNELDIMMNLFILFFPVINDTCPSTPVLEELPEYQESENLNQKKYQQWLTFSKGNRIYRKKIEYSSDFRAYVKDFDQKTIETRIYQINQDDLWYQLKGYCQGRNIIESKFNGKNSYENLLNSDDDIISENKHIILIFFDYFFRLE